jgi:hypothetical protein
VKAYQYRFPVLLECGTIAPVLLATDDKADFEYARMERGENEIVIRLRLSCRHPAHAAEVDA